MINKGREYKNPSTAEKLINAGVPGSVIFTLPDITEHTRIVAVCGVADAGDSVDTDKGPEGLASPGQDGWFVSDFYAFKHILKDAGLSQKWITCDSPYALVKRYGNYVQGSPFYERKVVLSETELKKPEFMRDMVSCHKNTLKATFMEYLEKDAKAALKDGQPLVVFVFAHGDYHDDFGMQIGPTPDKSNLFGVNSFKKIVDPGTRVTVFTTACCSGGWAVYNDFSMKGEGVDDVYTDLGFKLNASLATAAGPMSETISYGASISLGRYCGSFWASALLSVFREESEKATASTSSSSTSSKIPPEDTPQSQQTFIAFTEQVHDTVMQFDRTSHEHQIRFAAQDDDWFSAWGQRSGIPLINFKKNWDQLETVASVQNPSGVANRGRPINASEVDTSIPGQTGSFRNRPGTVKTWANSLKRECVLYLNSNPGPDNLANNTAFHTLMRNFSSGKYPETMSNMEKVFKHVYFRKNLAKLASDLLDLARIPLPKGWKCAKFDVDPFEKELPQRSKDKYTLALKEIRRSNLLPVPAPDLSQGRAWEKPNKYIAAAMTLDDNIKNVKDVTDTVERMRTCMDLWVWFV